jgi:antitoxin HicB
MNDPRFEDYPFEISPLSAEDGGGFLITFPDLPGCIADGETPEEALREGHDAFRCWMAAHIADGRPVPVPNAGGEPGKFVQRVPKSIHTKLATRARQEGVSLNTLVLAFIAEGLGRREGHA